MTQNISDTMNKKGGKCVSDHYQIHCHSEQNDQLQPQNATKPRQSAQPPPPMEKGVWGSKPGLLESFGSLDPGRPLRSQEKISSLPPYGSGSSSHFQWGLQISSSLPANKISLPNGSKGSNLQQDLTTVKWIVKTWLPKIVTLVTENNLAFFDELL